MRYIFIPGIILELTFDFIDIDNNTVSSRFVTYFLGVKKAPNFSSGDELTPS